MIRHSLIALFLFTVPLSAFAADEGAGRKSAGDLPAVKQLANPFVFADGTVVKSKDDWNRRRTELKKLFEDYEYGPMPAKPEKLSVKRGEVQIDEGAKIVRQEWTIHLEQGDKTLDLHASLTRPHKAEKPAPVVIQSGFGRIAGPRPGAQNPNAPQPNRYRLFTDRGYAVLEISFSEAALDNKEKARSVGIYQLYGDKIDTGGLMAWAWSVSRAIDAIEGDDQLDSKKIVVTGHSRYGKATLVAGAFDERIALTVPSHSGSGGASPYRFIYGKSEQLHNIVGAFPYWFRPDFNQFIDKVEHLPFDQHELIALVAPRALLATEGTMDAWINPEGSQLTHLAAKQVYRFLGAEEKLSLKFRPVGHIPSNEDLLEFADHVFFAKPLSAEFGKLAYPEEKKGFDWTAPDTNK